MGKLLIISDTHELYNSKELYDYEQANSSEKLLAIHAGDSQLSYSDSSLIDFDYRVRGNCDFDRDFPEIIQTEVSKLGQLFLTHGHLHRVKIDTAYLEEIAQDEQANLLVYGHTHVLDIRYLEESDLLIINPSSVALPKSNPEPTYVLLTFDDTHYEVEVKHAQTLKVLKQFSFSRKRS